MAEIADNKALFDEVIEALKREDGASVLARAPELLAASADSKGMRARVIAWLGQAEMFNGNFKAAGQAVRQAIALATEAGDNEGVQALKALQAQVAMRRQAAKGMEAAPLPLDLNTPVSRAAAAIHQGDLRTGEVLALEGLTQAEAAGDFREQILALLTLARLPGQAERHILRAVEVADQSDDMNLVTAAAKAAQAAGIALPKKVF